MEKKQDEYAEMADKMMKLMNHYGGEDKMAKELTLTLKNEHRTLQANFIRMVKTVVAEYAKMEWTDARNDAAVEWAKKATEATKDMGIPHI